MEAKDIQLVLNEIYEGRGLDFSQYRYKFLQRRINSRVKSTNSSSYQDYFRILKNNRDEMEALLNALTINVTQFFRDPIVFEGIKNKVIPAVIKEKASPSANIRIWSCGASAGEEAVSVLILFLERLKEDIENFCFYIYCTDIDKDVIKKAKEGIYKEYEFKTMHPALREKYFIDLGGGLFRRKKELDKFLIFKQHDVISNLPLCSMDMIMCRNLFIYFERPLQKLCVEKFYRSLNRGGVFVLGLTEFLLEVYSGRFVAFDRSLRLYRKA